MIVIFNATTLVKGGALQVAVSFIRQSLSEGVGVHWYYFLSKEVSKELTDHEMERLRPHATIFPISPARSKKSRNELLRISGEIGANAVFTLFGPAYVRFANTHICGVADGWVTHSTRLAFSSLESMRDQLRMLAMIIYKAFWYRKADAWIVEANNAKQGLQRRWKVPAEAVFVVPNTCSQIYRHRSVSRVRPAKGEKLKLLSLTAYYRSKNLEIIPKVAYFMERLGCQFEFEFVITLPEDDVGFKGIMSLAKQLRVEGRIRNVGLVKVDAAPELYEECHIAFVPSLLETFSANYPEAMAMGLPIVASDLDFARDACADAAMYYDPINAESAAKVILELMDNPEKWECLIDRGAKVLESLPTPAERFRRYVDIIRNYI